MTRSELLQLKIATITEVGAYLLTIHAPPDLYARLIETLDRDDKFWRLAVSPVNGWTIKFWVWFLFKQREPRRDNGCESVTGNGNDSGIGPTTQSVTGIAPVIG
jgi:hypothetical protein